MTITLLMPKLRLTVSIDTGKNSYLIFQRHYVKKTLGFFPIKKNCKDSQAGIMRLTGYMEILSQISLILSVFGSYFVFKL